MTSLIPVTNQPLTPGTRFGQDYYGYALPIIREQIAKAGVRVAWMLDEVFK